MTVAQIFLIRAHECLHAHTGGWGLEREHKREINLALVLIELNLMRKVCGEYMTQRGQRRGGKC
jgi:hypothetical protein